MLSVSDRMIDVRAKSTGQNVSIPHGMVVWSTGVGTRPIVKDFMDQIGQVLSLLSRNIPNVVIFPPQLVTISFTSFTGQSKGSGY